MTHSRLRDLGITIGSLPTGPLNAITDVPGVLVGQTTLITDTPEVARTGVTAILPRPNIHQDFVFSAYHSFNGIGEMTGLPFIEDTGLLTAPIVLTHTSQVGLAYDSVIRYGARKLGGFSFKLPVVAETYDGWLNDSDAFPLQEAHILAALEDALSGANVPPRPVAEGGAGGGTGMICYEFKGGTGTASRQVTLAGQAYTVGVLVQANHGDRQHLLVDGVPVGRIVGADVVPLPWPAAPATSSILIIIATDAPLLPNQCKRLAQRGTVGLARTGGYGLDGSGDLFMAFSTGCHYDPRADGLKSIQFVPHFSMDPLVIGTVEAVEEAILNALVAAETMVGREGHTAYALPHEYLTNTVKGEVIRPDPSSQTC
jgi:D-aminopeptidase